MSILILEKKKTEILNKIKDLGDIRRGSLSIRYQRCGKSPCVCDDPNHPGHGPIYSLSTVINGKSKIKNYKIGSDLYKLQKELGSYQRYKELSKELLTVSNKICELRPISEIENDDKLETLKKKLKNLYMKKSKKRLTA